MRKYCLILILLPLALLSCEKLIDFKDVPDDRVSVYNEVVKVIDERYALFPVKQTDWPALAESYKVRLDLSASEDAYFRLLSDLLFELKDGHITLISPVDTATYENFYTAYPKNFSLRVMQDKYWIGSEQIGPFMLKIQENVAYLYYSSFQNDIRTEDREKLLSKLEGTKGLILDLRDNSGGSLKNVKALSSFFMPDRTLVKYERFKVGPGHEELSDPQPFYTEPSASTYQQPLVVLTNRRCFSACNDFVLMMKSVPGCRQIGDQTGGGGSLPAEYVLSNGWRLRYSSSMTLSPAGESVEPGIQPDLKQDMSPIDEINMYDPILERAFQLLK